MFIYDIYKYFSEIKNRLNLVLLSWIAAVGTSYLYKEILLFLLIKSNVELYNLECFYFISTGLTDIFNVYLQLTYFVSTQLSFFVFLYHFLMFITPALFIYEYTILKKILKISYIIFYFNIIIFNYLIIPKICNFFFSFQNANSNQSINVFFEAKINEYVSFYIDFYIVSFFITQSLVVFYLFLNYRKKKSDFILRTRKSFYFIFCVFATVLTPPDIFSQVFLMVFCVLAFEFYIFLTFFKEV